MPKYTVKWPPDGWQVAHRTITIDGQEALRWFLQRLRPDDGLWEDFSGPYRQRGGAIARLQRLQEREVRQHRMAGDVIWHEYEERLGLPQPEIHR